MLVHSSSPKILELLCKCLQGLHTTFLLPKLATESDCILTVDIAYETCTVVVFADLETEAVLNIDDDITVTCNSLLQTFRVRTNFLYAMQVL